MPDVGTIYILTNVAMPDLVKIGCTTGPVEDRVRDLSGATGVPVAFVCHFAAKVDGFKEKERILHLLFSEQRINPKREFFRISPEKAVLAIRMGTYEDVTPGVVSISPAEDKALVEAEEVNEKRRSRLQLASIGIPIGAELTLSRDASIHATVVSGNKVDFEGQVMSLSAAALKALHQLGYKTPAASGSDYWTFEEESLDERRIRLESQLDDESSNISQIEPLSVAPEGN